MSLINISNCPVTNLNRKLDYQFLWLKTQQKIIIRCWVSHYKDNNLVENAAIKSFVRELIASDSLVNPINGVLLTEQQINDYNEAFALEQAYPGLVLEYQSQLETYNTQMVSYSADMLTYNTAMSAYSANVITYQAQIAQIDEDYASALVEYQNDYSSYTATTAQYQSDYAAFQLAQTVYEADLAQYQIDFSAWLLDQENLPQPVAPTEPTAPIFPMDLEEPTIPIKASYPEPPIQPELPIEPTEPTEPIEPPSAGVAPIAEYDFYAYVLGVTPIILPDLLQQIILLRDQEGKFNI